MLNHNGQTGKLRRRSRAKKAFVSEINVTPLVDVMLVLLIVFMVAAPLLVNGVPLELPKTNASPVKMDKDPLTVSIDNKGKYAINDQYFDTRDALITQLRALAVHKKKLANERIFIRGAKDINYEKMLKLIAAIQKAGFTNVALASLPNE